MSNWKVVNAADGTQYYQVTGQVYLSPYQQANPEGAAMFIAANPRYPGAGLGYESIGALGDGFSFPVIYDEPGSQSDPDPPQPSGRFQNLDFGEAL